MHGERARATRPYTREPENDHHDRIAPLDPGPRPPASIPALLPLIHGHILAGSCAGINLSWTRDLLIFIGEHFLPL